VTWSIVLGVGLSFLIELAQTAIPGRHPTLGDVLTNGTGTALGVFVGTRAAWWRPPSRPLSWLTLAMGCVAFLATPVLLAPALGDSDPWYAHWTPRQDYLEWYRGRVLSAEIGGIPLLAGRLPSAEAVRERLGEGEAVTVVAVVGPPIDRLGSLFHLSDSDLRQTLLLGPEGEDLVFQYRTRAATLQFDAPELQIRGAFSDLAVGDTILVAASVGPRGVCLAFNERVECPARFPVGRGWALVLYPRDLSPRFVPWIDFAWVAGFAALVAFWGPTRRESLVQVVILAAVAVGAALASPFVSIHWTTVAGLPAGLLLGWTVGAGTWRRPSVPRSPPRSASA
jgi:hypothetical protein